MSTKIMQLCLEEASDGVTEIEHEKVFYATIESSAILAKASSKEYQEQYQVDIPKTDFNQQGGRIRVRATTKDDGNPTYVLTIKIKSSDKLSDAETSMITTKDQFDQFKLIATNGMVKTRYVYPIPGQTEVWEVDVFPLQSGSSKGKNANWCKIDYEFKDPNKREIPPLPDGFNDVIPGDTQDPEERAFITNLYEKIFLFKLV